jgi:hypothetical protein
MVSASVVLLSVVFVAPISWRVILHWTDWLVTERVNFATALERLLLVFVIDNLSMPRCNAYGRIVLGS